MTHPVDMKVGERIRLRRKLLGFTQTELAEELGVAFQQIQKYECGDNRVSASRLFEIAQALNVSVSFFFEELESSSASADQPNMPNLHIVHGTEREIIELVRAYTKLENPVTRRNLRDLIRGLAHSKAVSEDLVSSDRESSTTTNESLYPTGH